MTGAVGQLEDPFGQNGFDGLIEQGRFARIGRKLLDREGCAERIGCFILRVRKWRLDDPERVLSGSVRDPGSDRNQDGGGVSDSRL